MTSTAVRTVNMLRLLQKTADELRKTAVLSPGTSRVVNTLEMANQTISELEADRKRLADERDRALEAETAVTAALDLLGSDEYLGAGLISDDFGNWAVSGSGFQSITDRDGLTPTKEKPITLESSFLVEADEWSSSIHEALRVFVERHETERSET